MKPFVHRSALAITTILALSGCGGGSSSSNSSTSSNNYTAPVAINDTNAVGIAASVISGGNMAESFASAGLPTGISSSTTHTRHEPSYQLIINQTLSSARRAISSTHPDANVTVGIVNTLSGGNCPNGGSYSVTWDDANNNRIEDGGDTLSLVDIQCETIDSYTDAYGNPITDTTITNGTSTFFLTDLTGDSTSSAANWSMGFTFSTNRSYSYSSTDGYSWSFSTQGGATLAASYDASTMFTDMSLTGSSLKETYSYGGYNFSTELANFNFSLTSDDYNSLYTLDIDYALLDSSIGGSVTVVTDPVFAGTIISGAKQPPTSGKMVIVGANNTQVVVEATTTPDTALITVNNGSPYSVSWTNDLGWNY